MTSAAAQATIALAERYLEILSTSALGEIFRKPN
jgi:hypothetical protein